MKKLIIILTLLLNTLLYATNIDELDTIFSTTRLIEIPDIAKNLSARGSIHHSKKEYPQAVELYSNSLELREKIGLKDSMGYANTIFLRSIAKHKLGDSCNAIKDIQKAIIIYTYLGKLNDIQIAEEESENYKNHCSE